MEYKKLYVTQNRQNNVTGIFGSIDDIVKAYQYMDVDLDVLSLERTDFNEEPIEILSNLFVSLVEVNPIFFD